MGAVTGFGKEFKCEICGAMFEDVEQLMAHLREHSSGMPSGANDRDLFPRGGTSS